MSTKLAKTMDKSSKKLIKNLHKMYPKQDKDTEDHITRLLADSAFITRADAAKIHAQYHKRD